MSTEFEKWVEGGQNLRKARALLATRFWMKKIREKDWKLLEPGSKGVVINGLFSAHLTFLSCDEMEESVRVIAELVDEQRKRIEEEVEDPYWRSVGEKLIDTVVIQRLEDINDGLPGDKSMESIRELFRTREGSRIPFLVDHIRQSAVHGVDEVWAEMAGVVKSMPDSLVKAKEMYLLLVQKQDPDGLLRDFLEESPDFVVAIGGMPSWVEG